MLRTIINIDEERCNGCGLCAAACHEGAIGMVDGRARLLRDDYCDGLGDCLPACPTGAITFIEREAAAYDEAAVTAAKAGAQATPAVQAAKGASAAPTARTASATPANQVTSGISAAHTEQIIASELRQWPVQIKLAPTVAPYFNGADLLVAADCTAFSYGDFHTRFMRGRITLVGCPKLDAVDYSEKLTQIFSANDIHSITVARMEVPCCGGLEHAVRRALEASGKDIPLEVVTLSTDGRILA